MLKLNLQKLLIYRLNAFFNLVTTTVYLLTFVASLYLTFRVVPTIGGYSYQDMLLFLMLGQTWWFIQVMFVRKNMQYMMKAINNGGLDMHLLKPVKLWFLIPFLQVDSNHILPAIGSIIIIIFQISNYNLSLLQIFLALIFYINSFVIIYFFTAIFTFLNFWTGRNEGIFDITFYFPDLVQLPVEFFNGFLQILFTFVFPVTLIINPTIQALKGKIDYGFLGLTLLITSILGFLAYTVWKLGLKAYTSAN